MDLSTLNEAQKASVVNTEGNIRVVAGAGSGKTRALVYRYAYIVNVLGVPQSNILCLTFTNKAAQEMKRRISTMIPGGATGDFVSTIHGFCVKVRIMTIHQTKGLEFPAVYIYGLNEGIFPSHRTIRERGEDGLEEERRLMYVACTRAMDKLFFTESEGYNVQNSQGKYPSRFIREACDGGGPLYETIGRFDPSLWEGTDALIAKLDAEINVAPKGADKERGQKVHHSVFGNGVILEMDEETGVATVQFEGFGVRKVRQDILTEPKE